jgi:hypothetical protein
MSDGRKMDREAFASPDEREDRGDQGKRMASKRVWRPADVHSHSNIGGVMSRQDVKSQLCVRTEGPALRATSACRSQSGVLC